MGRQIVHFEIMGGQGEQLRDFYGRLFDWKIDTQPEFDYGLVDPQTSGLGGGIGPAGDGPARVTVYISVPDIDATLAEVTAAGGEVVMPREDIGMVVIAMFKDPAGNVTGLIEAPEPQD